MIFFTQRELDDFQAACPSGRLMGFDVGTQTVGLALSDPTRQVARGLMGWKRKKWSVDGPGLVKLLESHETAGLVVGWPLNMDGTPGPQCQGTRDFAKNLQALASYPLLLWDERLSTRAVTRTLLAADVSRQKRAIVEDKLAACYILQGALDALERRRRRPSCAP